MLTSGPLPSRTTLCLTGSPHPPAFGLQHAASGYRPRTDCLTATGNTSPFQRERHVWQLALRGDSMLYEHASCISYARKWHVLVLFRAQARQSTALSSPWPSGRACTPPPPCASTALSKHEDPV